MTGPDPRMFFALFPADDVRAYEHVPAERVPEPYRRLLVHEYHMTVTVEAYHGSLVDVRVVQTHREGDEYARKSLLVLQSTGRIVQLGMVRIHLEYCTPAVREEIVAGQTPLGRILINHGLLTTVRPTAFLRILPGKQLQEWFGLEEAMPTYGRLAVITWNDKPAIEVLEIEAPEAPAPNGQPSLQ